MSLHVHIPIRLKLDAAVLEAGGAELDEVLSLALGRALQRADDFVLQARPDARLVVRSAPVLWHGTGLVEIGPDQRRATEDLVAATISAALARRLRRTTARPEVLPVDPWEPFDPSRMTEAGYSVDSYQPSATPRPGRSVFWFKGKTEGLSFITKDEQIAWWQFTDEQSLAQYALQASEDARTSGRLSAGTRFGVLFARPYKANQVLWAAVFDQSGGGIQARAIFPIGNFGMWDVVPKEGAAKTGKAAPRALHVDPVGTFALKILSGRPFDAFLKHWGAQFGILDRSHPRWARLHDATRDIVDRSLFPDGTPALLFLQNNAAVSITLPSDVVVGNVPLLPLAKVRRKRDRPEGEAEGGDGAQSEGESDEGKGTDKGGAGGGGQKKGAGGGKTADAGKGQGSGEAGDGDQGDGIAKDGTGDEDAIVHGETGRKGGALLPAAKIRGKYRPDLGPFQGEPAIEALGDIGRRMRNLIARIAFRLEMDEGHYAGAFALAAARVLGGRATGAADYGIGEGQAQAAKPLAPGNLGSLQFEVGDSQAIRVMKHLAATAPLINALSRLVLEVALDGRNRALFAKDGPDPGSWALHFRIAYYDAIQSSIMWTFVATCQVILLQLTSATLAALQERKAKMDVYFPVVSKLIGGLMAGEAHLRELHAQLLAHKASGLESKSAVFRQSYESWRDARVALTGALGGVDENEALLADYTHEGMKGTIVTLKDGTAGIEALGRVWTLQELEQAIQQRFDIASSVDPVVKHIHNVPVAVALFKGSDSAARRWLDALLDDLIAANKRVTHRAEDSALWSFRASRLHEDLAHATIPNTSVVLGGVHLMAHQALGPMFEGDEWYAFSLNHLFSHELGRTALIEFATLAGPLILGVICPPLGVALNVAISVVGYYYARQDQDIPKAILDPDLVLSREEAEMELFMAEFALALAVIPEAGSILGKSMGLVSKVATKGVVTGGRLALQQMRRKVLVAMARELKLGLPYAFAKAILTDQVMGYVIGQVLNPAFEAIMQEVAFATTGVAPGMAPGTSGETGPLANLPITASEAALLYELEGTPESETDE